uniref:PST19 n=1 Tax=Triticum aestivum TaxID=4565 RepID=Q9ATQ9_WHEAT|nr:PST19 [Triticum aestivum]
MSFHRSSSSGTGGDDGPSAWPSSLSKPETEELYRFGVLVPPGCRLPLDWKLDKDGYTTRGPSTTAEEKRTGSRCNIVGRHEFWDGKDYAAVISAFRLAESGVTPDLNGDRRHLLVPRPHPEARGRRAPPPPAPSPADPPAPPEVELPPEQVVLREDGDPDDTPGYLVALRASVAAAAAAAVREAAEQAAAIQAAAAIPPVVPQAEAAESSEEDVIDWDRLARSSDDNDDDGGSDGATEVIFSRLATARSGCFQKKDGSKYELCMKSFRFG